MKIRNLNFLDSTLIVLSLIPLWLFEYKNIFDFESLIIVFLIIILIILILNFLKTKKSFLYYFSISLVAVYGIDSKLGLWKIFDEFSKTSPLRYFLSAIPIIVLLILLFKVFKKNNNIKIFLNIFLFLIILINIITSYFFMF